MSAEGENVAHCVEGGVSEVHQQGLFICNPDGELGRQKVRYWIREIFIVKIDVSEREHRCRHRVRRSFEV